MSRVAELVQQYREARRSGRADEARRLLMEADQLGRATGDQRGLVDVLKGLAQLDRDEGRPDAATPRYEEAVAIGRTLNDPLLLAHTVRHLGDLHLARGDLATAGQCFDEAVSLYRTHPGRHELDLANALRSVALHREATGHLEHAARLWAEARDGYARAGIDAAIAECERRLATLVPPDS